VNVTIKYLIIKIIILLISVCTAESQYRYNFDFDRNWEWNDLYINSYISSHNLIDKVQALSKEFSQEEGWLVFRSLVNLDSLNQLRLLVNITDLEVVPSKYLWKSKMSKELKDFNEKEDLFGLIEAATRVANLRRTFSEDKKLFRDNNFFLRIPSGKSYYSDIKYDFSSANNLLDLLDFDYLNQTEIDSIISTPPFNYLFDAQIPCYNKEQLLPLFKYIKSKTPIFVIYKFINQDSFLGWGNISVNTVQYRRLINTIQKNREALNYYILNILYQYLPVDVKFLKTIKFTINKNDCGWNNETQANVINFNTIGDDYEILARYMCRDLFLWAKKKIHINVFPYLLKDEDTLIYNLMNEVFDGGISNYIAPILAENRPANLLEKDFRLFNKTIDAILTKKPKKTIDSLLKVGLSGKFMFHTMGWQMANTIDLVLGRDALKESLLLGPFYFFETYVEAYEKDPVNIKEVYQFNNNFETKIFKLRALIPKNLLLNAVNIKMQNGNKSEVQKAIASMKKESYSINSVLKLVLAVLEFDFGMFDEAYECIITCKENILGREKLLQDFGFWFLEKGKIAESQTLFDLLVKYYPQSSNSYYCRGNFYYQTGSLDKAKQDLIKALEIDPNFSRASNLLSRINEDVEKKKL
jgi:tetratricopeptide (TPR) repeat protein